MLLAVRTAGKPLSLASAVKQQVWNVDKDQPIANVGTAEGALREWVAPRWFTMAILLNFAVIAILLTVVGLYGVLAYSVTLRTREIGIRLALGAQPRKVTVSIIREGLWMTLGGIAIGIAGSLLLTRYMQSVIYGVSSTDWATFVSVPLRLVLTLILASYIPARRASKIDPMEALRMD